MGIDYASLLRSMLEASGTTLAIFGLTLLFGLPLGLLAAAGRLSRFKPLRWLIPVYLQIMRGTPLMLQLFFFCYGPYYLFRVSGGNRFTAAIVAFVLNYAAYFAEIYRAGIESIPVGQYEAAGALGFTRRQTFFRIILPQVVKRILPPMGNEFMTLVKDTSLARVIAIVELFTIAEKTSSNYFSTVPLLIAGVFYFVMNAVVGKCFAVAEKRLDYYR